MATRELPDTREGMVALLSAPSRERKAKPKPLPEAKPLKAKRDPMLKFRHKARPSLRVAPAHMRHVAHVDLTRALMRSLYARYEAQAKHRQLPFTLSKRAFAAMWQRPCSYCGIAIQTIGIDRIDSRLGYTDHNCAPACWPCNRAKSNMSLDAFIRLCKRVAAGH